jgi:hypothetical protein
VAEEKETKSKSEARPKAGVKQAKDPRPPKAKPSPREEDELEKDDEAEEDEDESEDGESEDEGDDESEDESDDEEDEAAAEGERDESTKGVARALGVDSDEEEEEEEEAKEVETPLNRAQRRREEAMKRRAAREGTSAGLVKKGGAAVVEDEAVEAKEAESKLPKDKNARAKELLKRRRESAAGLRVTKLDTAEMVQDSLARATAASGRFVKNQWKIIAAVIVIGLGGSIAFFAWQNHKEVVAGVQSDELDRGLLASRGHITAKDLRTDDDKKVDPTPVYATLEARADAQLAAYDKVVAAHPGSGPAILAKLGQATAYLDKAQWDQAISAFNEVAGSPLAAADVDVKARSIEGVGFAKEGKGDFDGALASFKDLEATGVKGLDDLGKYHQGRMLLKKGQTDAAKEIFVALQKKLEIPSLEGSESEYVKEATNEYLKAIDPTLVKKKNNIGGMRGNSLTPDDLKDLDEEKLRRLQEMLKHAGEHGDDGMPMPGDLP